jgi:hypothetical protein
VAKLDHEFHGEVEVLSVPMSSGGGDEQTTLTTVGAVTAVTWRHCHDLPDDAADGDWVRAGREDLIEDRQAVLRDTEAGLTFMPVVEFIDGSDWLTVKVSADGMLTTPREVKLSPTVIRRAVASPDVSPLTLLACALAVPNGDLGSGWRPKRVGGALPLPQRLLEEQGNLFRWIDSAQRIGAALNELKDVLITGDHGSGKTCMAAHFARQHEEQRGGLIWLDLSDPADGAESILATLLSTEISKQYLLVVDGMQANITVIESVLSCVTRLRSVFQITIQVLATGWGSVAERLPESFRHMVPFNVQGADLIDVYLAEESLANDVRKQLRELAKGDIHIAATALALHKRLARVPDRRDLQVEYTRGVDDDGMRHALYWCACLAFFEIDVSRSTAERKFGKALERLQSSGRIQFSDSSLTVGPRARAALILRHAHHEWEADTKWGRPRDITWQYLRSHDDLLIKAMLGRLDLSSQSDGFRPGTRYLLTAWDLLGQLQRQLERDCEQNPTRNDLVGNAAFTAIALARLGSRERWADVVDKLRDRWVYDGSAELPRTQDGTDSSDFVHFTRIRAEMLAEDEQLRGAPYLVNQPGDAIDLPRFYRTWVLGLLLGVEGRAPVPDPDRTRKLHAIAAAAQDPVGFFYPRRVPWNTARVILGLVAAGFDYNNDEVVRRACQWLLRPVHDGGAFSDDDGYWHSGTGTWNTDEATTAMCLTALAQAGAPRSPVREMAYAWLADGEKRWTARGREIDLAHVLEALLHGPDDPAELHRLVEQLLHRLSMARDGRAPLTPDVPEDTHRIPFVTAQLASIVWNTVYREFTKLLEDLTAIDFGREPMQPGFATADEPLPAPPALNGNRRINCHLTADQLGQWRDAVALLRQTLTEGIRSRALALGRTPNMTSVREKLEQLQRSQVSVRRLTDLVAEVTPRAVLLELNELGHQVCGDAWPEPPVPDEDSE